MTMPRLVQVVVQPVVVADDGETLMPITIQQIVVAAADWPAFSAEKWPALMKQIAAEIDAQDQSTTDA